MIVSGIGILCSAAVSNPLLNGLVGAWNGNSNTNDSIGTNNGTIVGGVTYVAGKVNNAFSFNGTTGNVQLANNSWKPTNFTYCGWFTMTSSGSANCVLASLGSSSTGYNNGLAAYVSGGKLYSEMYAAGVTKSISYTGISIGVQYFYSMKFDGTTLSLRVRTTGGIDSTVTLATTMYPAYEATQYATIGAYRCGTLYYPFAGWIDITDYYSRAITTAEENSLYNNYSGLELP